MKRLSKGLDWVENILAAFGGGLIVFATFSVLLEVFSRSFLNYSFIWVTEITSYILLYVPFLGAAWLLRKNAHITVNIFASHMSPLIKKISNFSIAVIGIIVCAILSYYGYLTVVELGRNDIRSLTPTAFPLAYIMFCIPLGSVVLMLEFLRKFCGLIWPVSLEEDEWIGG